MVDIILISSFFICWLGERIYYYYNNCNYQTKALLDLNTSLPAYNGSAPLSNPSTAEDYAIDTVKNDLDKSSNIL